jgi:hypothetical protein
VTHQRAAGEDPALTDGAPLTDEELDELVGQPLPERVALSLVNPNIAAPVHVAAASHLSDESVAVANAAQDAPVDQTG